MQNPKFQNCTVENLNKTERRKSQGATWIRVPTSKGRLKTNLAETEWKSGFYCQLFWLFALMSSHVLWRELKCIFLRKSGGWLCSGWMVGWRWGKLSKSLSEFSSEIEIVFPLDTHTHTHVQVSEIQLKWFTADSETNLHFYQLQILSLRKVPTGDLTLIPGIYPPIHSHNINSTSLSKLTQRHVIQFSPRVSPKKDKKRLSELLIIV